MFGAASTLQVVETHSFLRLNKQTEKLREATPSRFHMQPRHYEFAGSEFNEAERERGREIGSLITLIITCSCDLLNCKVHLNPPANYGTLCARCELRLAVEMELSWRVIKKEKKTLQSLALIKC